MKYFKILTLILLLSSNGYTKSTSYKYDQKIVEEVLIREEIDLDSKSLKGWIRLFNSRDKINAYDIYISIEERKQMLLYLNCLYNKKNKKNKENSKIIK